MYWYSSKTSHIPNVCERPGGTPSMNVTLEIAFRINVSPFCQDVDFLMTRAKLATRLGACCSCSLQLNDTFLKFVKRAIRGGGDNVSTKGARKKSARFTAAKRQSYHVTAQRAKSAREPT